MWQGRLRSTSFPCRHGGSGCPEHFMVLLVIVLAPFLQFPHLQTILRCPGCYGSSKSLASLVHRGWKDTPTKPPRSILGVHSRYLVVTESIECSLCSLQLHASSSEILPALPPVVRDMYPLRLSKRSGMSADLSDGVVANFSHGYSLAAQCQDLSDAYFTDFLPRAKMFSFGCRHPL